MCYYVFWNYIKKKFAFQSLSNLCAAIIPGLESSPQSSFQNHKCLCELSFICSSVMHPSIWRSLMEKDIFFYFRFVPVEPFLYDFPFTLTLAYISDLTPDLSVAFFLLPWLLSFCSFDRTYIWDCIGVFLWYIFALVHQLGQLKRNAAKYIYTVQSQFKLLFLFSHCFFALLFLVILKYLNHCNHIFPHRKRMNSWNGWGLVNWTQFNAMHYYAYL